MPKLKPKLSPTFLDSFQYYRTCRSEDYSDQARLDLINRLNGIRFEPNEAMLKGVKFEDDVCKFLDGEDIESPNDAYYDCITEVSELVRGSQRQVHVSYDLGNVTLHGYIDFLLPGVVVDTKTTKSYKMGKYLNHNQHLVYLLALKKQGYRKFSYVVSDFRHVYKEDYTLTRYTEQIIRDRVSEFMDYLAIDPEMETAFWEKAKRNDVKA